MIWGVVSFLGVGGRCDTAKVRQECREIANQAAEKLWRLWFCKMSGVYLYLVMLGPHKLWEHLNWIFQFCTMGQDCFLPCIAWGFLHCNPSPKKGGRYCEWWPACSHQQFVFDSFDSWPMSWDLNDLMGCELGDGRTAVKHLIGFQKMSIVNCHVEPLGPGTIFSRGKEAIPDSAFLEVFRDAATATFSALVFQRGSAGARNMVYRLFMNVHDFCCPT